MSPLLHAPEGPALPPLSGPPEGAAVHFVGALIPCKPAQHLAAGLVDVACRPDRVPVAGIGFALLWRRSLGIAVRAHLVVAAVVPVLNPVGVWADIDEAGLCGHLPLRLSGQPPTTCPAGLVRLVPGHITRALGLLDVIGAQGDLPGRAVRHGAATQRKGPRGDPGHAEVHRPHDPLAADDGDHDVAGADIAVDEAALVCDVHGRQERLANRLKAP